MRTFLPASLFFAVTLLSFASRALGGTQVFIYDAAGRLMATDHGSGKSISYAYDSAGNLLQSSQPSPGLIVTALTSGQFTLSWPAAPGGFVLESSPALGAGALWTDTGLTPSLSGNRFSATVIIAAGSNKFYRLRKL